MHTALSLREHRHLLSRCSQTYQFKTNVIHWMSQSGIGAYAIRSEMEDMPHAPGYVQAYPVAFFESPDDAFAFKMKWL